MNSKRKVVFAGVLFAFMVCRPGFSQAVPGGAKAGVVEKGFRKKKKPGKLKKDVYPLIEIEEPEDQLQLGEDKKFFVEGFEYKGNTAFADIYLNRLVIKYTTRRLSIKDIKEVCRIITQAYKEKGFFLTSVYPPVQEIRDGVVTLRIVEAKLGEVQVAGQKHYDEKFIRKNFHVGTEEIVNYNSLLKSLFILNEYPDLKVKAQFQKGKAPYTVDAALKVEDKLAFHGAITYNNFGSGYISKHNFSTEFQYSNLVTGGDTIFLRAVTSSPKENLFFGEAGYSLPINSYGTKAAFSYVRSDFDVQKEFRTLDSGGCSKIYSLDLEHPLIRTPLTNMDFTFGFDYKQLKNYLLGSISSDDELRVIKTGFNYGSLDNRGGRNYCSFLVSNGIDGIMGSSNKNDPLSSRVGAGGEFIKANLDLARLQEFFLESFILMRWALQTSSDVLPVSEQFSLGGPDSVRGFPQAEYLGDNGYFLSLELRSQPPFIAEKTVPFTSLSYKEFIQLLAFLDWGAAYLENPLVGESKKREISGAGFGARINFSKDFNLRIDVGFPLSGEEPSDGSNSRVHIQAITKF